MLLLAQITPLTRFNLKERPITPGCILPMQSSTQAQPFDHANESAEPFVVNPLALLAGALATGILTTSVISISFGVIIGTAACLASLALISFLKHNNKLTTYILTLLAILLGSMLASVEKSSQPVNQLKRLLEHGTGVIVAGESAEITGVLERDPEITPERLYLNLRVERVRTRTVEREVSGEVLLMVPVAGKSFRQELEQLDLRYGARLRVMSSLERWESFRNPGVSSFTEYLDRKGYDATGFVKSPLLIERLENTRVFVPLAWLYEWRRRMQAAFHSHFDSSTAGVLDAALLGNRYNLSREASERFRDGGTFHVLVISGLHITFLGGVVFLLARRLTKNDAARFSLSVAVVWGYSVAVGAETSVLRAALMFTLVLLAPLLSRRASSLNALGGAALLLLVWQPSDLFDPSFQLTFVSVLAIVVVAWPLLQRASEIGSWHPTRETPYPPSAPSWLRTICEVLFWSEREWKRELNRANYNYKLFKSPLARTLDRYHVQRGLRYVFAAVVVSASVQLALLPFLVIYFHRVSLASLVLNIVVSLMMGGMALTGALALLCSQISFALSWPFTHLTNGINWLMVHSVDPFSRMGVASIRLPEYSGRAAVVYGLYYVPLFILAVLLDRWQPLPAQSLQRQTKANSAIGSRQLLSFALAMQVLGVATIVFHPYSEAAADGKLRIDFLDVGQGDSALVTFPDNTTLLIDGGGNPGPFLRDKTEQGGDEAFERETRRIGEVVVSEYLWWRGLDRVDYLIATHADADHIDGLNDVARNFKVRVVLLARTPGGDAEYARLVKTLVAKGIPVQAIGGGDVLRIGKVSVDVLWPKPSENPDAASRNNESIVMRLHFGERSILFTGDIESAGEKLLLSALANVAWDSKASLHADVVKVAHHGSKTSSTEGFVAATGARWAVIPVGRSSRFGHPHVDVVQRWLTAGASVLTTGEKGMITVKTDGRDLRVEEFVTGQSQSE